MKLLRFVLECLGLLIALALLLVAAAFLPVVQTWAAQEALDHATGMQVSLGSLSVGFGGIDVTDLRAESRGAILTVPSLHATLPLPGALWRHKVLVRELVAKGWTLDLIHLSGLQGSEAGAVSAGLAAGVVHRVLGSRGLPFDFSLDGTDLEGDVLAPSRGDGGPIRIRVAAKGGGLAAGQRGSFAFEATAVPPEGAAPGSTLRGSLAVTMDPAGAVRLVEAAAELPPVPGSAQAGGSVSAAAARIADGETYHLDIARGGRHVLTADGTTSGASRRLEGAWSARLRDFDIAPLVPGIPLPYVAFTGKGRFYADAGFAGVRLTGQVRAVVGGLGAFAPRLDAIGNVSAGADFDLTQRGRSLRVDSISLVLAGARPFATFRLQQPLSIDEDNGDLKPANSAASLMSVSVRGLPLAWLSAPTDRYAVSGGDAEGDFALSAGGDGFSLRSTTPLSARNVSLRRDGVTLARGLDLSLTLAASHDPEGWHAQAAPLAIDSAGQRIATVSARISRASGEDPPVEVTGTCNANIAAPEFRLAFPGSEWIRGRTASAEFTATVGSWSEVQVKATVAGREPGRVVTASFGADIDAGGAGTFVAPARFASGTEVTDVSAEGTWSGTGPARRVDVKLSGEDVALGDLLALAVPLTVAGGAEPPSGKTPGGGREGVPFWGGWVGRAKFSFDRLRAGGRDFNDVDGTLDLDRRSAHLLGARGWLPNHSAAKAEGTISFDPSSGSPYSLEGSAALESIEARTVLPKPGDGEDPEFEGRFGISATFSGGGAGPGDLFRDLRAKYQVRSTGGILRILRTNVADSIPEAPSKASDSLRNVGSLVGSLFGVKRHEGDSGENHLAGNTEAVLDFTNAIGEIGFDRLYATARSEPDGSLLLEEIAIDSANVRLTGSGRIAPSAGLPLTARPLSLEFELGARGSIAGLLSKAGLLSGRKDKLGYSILGQPVRLAGSLEHIDDSPWREMLSRAATPGTGPGRK